MGKVKNLIFCAIFCLLLPGQLLSETIILKSGQRVEGKIAEKTDRYVKLEFQGVELVYYNDEIASIEQADPGSVNGVNPQLESLYKAYTASLEAPKSSKQEGDKVKERPAQTTQAAPAAGPAPDLSQLPSEYKKMIQTALQTASGGQAGQSVAGMPAEADLSQLPPEYQGMLKEAAAKLQAAGLNLPEKK